MTDKNKTHEQKLWNAFLQFANDAYSFKKDAQRKAEAYAEAGNEKAADALQWIAEYAERMNDLLSEKDLDNALQYLDEFDDTMANNGKSFLNNFCGE